MNPGEVTANLLAVKQLIDLYEKKYQRKPGSVSLLAVSKNQSLEKMMEAYQQGQRLFGESYWQEAQNKILTLQNTVPEPIEWHFIGKIQRNKTRKIAEHFNWVHSVPDSQIAERLNNQRPDTLPPLNICIEINLSHEITKSGTALENLNELVKFCLNLNRLKLRGLMAIPAPASTLDEQRKSFRLLRDTLHTLQNEYPSKRANDIQILDTLSMGMSEDFEAAIAEGSTIVRIGTALFGKRL